MKLYPKEREKVQEGYTNLTESDTPRYTTCKAARSHHKEAINKDMQENTKRISEKLR